MSKLRYSIIYAVIRPEITERLSIGIIIVDGKSIDIRYSDKKLQAVKLLYSEKEYDFISKTVRNLRKNRVINCGQDIEYLSRYSNNLLSLSKLQTMNLEASRKNKDWLYHSYVHS